MKQSRSQSRRLRTTSNSSPVKSAGGLNPIEKYYVLLASFVVGAVILVVEIVGTRVISPYYGVTIYVWSSLIGVTLGSLAVGYWLGGIAADRWPRVDTLAMEVIGGGMFLLLVPWFRRSILSWSTLLGVKAGSLLSAAVLFAVPLTLLSMTGPLAIRLVTTEFTVLGRGVGWVYGISTLGSMLGAIATGFVLIPTFSVRSLLLGLALTLLLLGGAGLLFARRMFAAAAALALTIIAATRLGATAARSSNVVYLGNSFYGELKVVDINMGRPNLRAKPVEAGSAIVATEVNIPARFLLINGIDNGFVNRNNFESLAPYIGYFAYLPAARPQATRALFVGLGSGSVPRSFNRRHQIATEVVEVDPAVYDLARRYFDFPPEVPVIIEDGRRYLERTTTRYDFVILDAFNSEVHPPHLFTTEFFASVHRALAPDGLFAINMIAMPYGEPDAWRAVYATLRQHFPRVRVFFGDDVRPQDVDRYTNLFFVASDETLPPPSSLSARDAREGNVFAHMARRELALPTDPADGIVLSDDYNPLDDLQRRLFILWRQDVIRETKNILLFDGTEW